MAERIYLGVDLGASGGRVVAGLFDGQRIQLEEVHRFANGPVHLGGRTYWDLLRLWGHVKDGLRAAHHRYGGKVVSVGVDTWGVDFALLGNVPEGPPTAAITAPATNAVFPPGNVTINATASDPDGVVTNVEFYANGVKIQSPGSR